MAVPGLTKRTPSAVGRSNGARSLIARADSMRGWIFGFFAKVTDGIR
jgi:hypothetical protein